LSSSQQEQNCSSPLSVFISFRFHFVLDTDLIIMRSKGVFNKLRDNLSNFAVTISYGVKQARCSASMTNIIWIYMCVCISGELNVKPLHAALGKERFRPSIVRRLKMRLAPWGSTQSYACMFPFVEKRNETETPRYQERNCEAIAVPQAAETMPACEKLKWCHKFMSLPCCAGIDDCRSFSTSTECGVSLMLMRKPGG